MEPYIAQITMFAGNFAPRGWAYCNGQLLSIAQNTALFSLIGTTYGGDGRTTMGLPDLRGRVPIHAGTGPGLSLRPLGQRGGTETVTLSINQMPAHTHAATAKTTVAVTVSDVSVNVSLQASSKEATSTTPTSSSSLAVVAAGRGKNTDALIYNTETPDTSLSGGEAKEGTATASAVATTTVTTVNAGGSKLVNNVQPFLTVNYIIALVGVFPSRN
ncbi:MAG: phage tail protein [Aliivibrio sp.]|uniref:phage tail protein n=1 Tax=Aliivibrio sp. TaxID=1872443 RepID=UPI001A48DB87|nr:phage tail protein [Aliivibrio sp.]